VESKLWEKFQDSAILLAVISSGLYFVGVNYLRGYLEFYSARAEWFNPSIYHLVSFGFIPISFAVFISVGLFLLMRPMWIPNGVWWILYTLWSVALLSVTIVAFIKKPSLDFMSTGLNVILPILSRYFIQRLKRSFEEQDKRGEPPQVFSSEAEKKKELEKLKQEIEMGRRSVLAANIFFLLLMLYWLGHYGYRIGTTTALLDYQEIPSNSSVLRSDPKTHSGVIFGDGVAYLVYERDGDKKNFYFVNESAGISIQVFPKEK